jgi:hypothetical protein
LGYFWLAALVGIAAVFVTSLFRPRRDRMRSMMVEVNRQGLWRQTRRTRDLLLGRAEFVSIDVFKSRVNEILCVELNGKHRSVRVQGLDYMDRFVDDLRQQFPNLIIDEHRSDEDPGRP